MLTTNAIPKQSPSYWAGSTLLIFVNCTGIIGVSTWCNPKLCSFVGKRYLNKQKEIPGLPLWIKDVRMKSVRIMLNSFICRVRIVTPLHKVQIFVGVSNVQILTNREWSPLMKNDTWVLISPSFFSQNGSQHFNIFYFKYKCPLSSIFYSSPMFPVFFYLFLIHTRLKGSSNYSEIVVRERKEEVRDAYYKKL